MAAEFGGLWVCCWFLSGTNADDAMPTTDGMAGSGSKHKLGSKAGTRKDGKERPSMLGVASNERCASRPMAGSPR